MQTSNFRNLTGERLVFSKGINLISGRNGEGKTNLLEAIATLGNVRSFRTRNVSKIVAQGKNRFAVLGEVVGRDGKVILETSVDVGPPVRRRLSVGHKSVSAPEYLLTFPVVALTREDSDLVMGPPQGRRSFLDRLTFQLDPGHYDRLIRYRKGLANRNAALGVGATDREIEAWEVELARYAAAVIIARRTTLERISERFSAVWEALSVSEFPRLTLRYKMEAWGEENSHEELEKQYRERYAGQRRRDRDAGFTLSGPHRHDVAIEAAGRLARDHLSTGQIKLVGAGLRIAALELLEAARGETLPVLIDDVDAELDQTSVQRLMIRASSNRQLFVTSARMRPAAFAQLEATRLRMEGGVCRAIGETANE